MRENQSWGVGVLPAASRVTGRWIAVIGGGVSGLTAAYLLAQAGEQVTLFEADDRLGGHADTHLVAAEGGHQYRSTPASSSTTTAPTRS